MWVNILGSAILKNQSENSVKIQNGICYTQILAQVLILALLAVGTPKLFLLHL